MLEHILYTACVIPFDDTGSAIDYKSLERRLCLQEQAENGIVVLASTGEGLSLTAIASNAWPYATRHYVEKRLGGQNMESHIWWRTGDDLFIASNPIPIKAWLKDLGIIDHDTVRLPLCLEDVPSRKTRLDHHNAIINGGIYHE